MDTTTYALDQTTFKKTLMDTTQKKRSMLQEFLGDVPLLRVLSQYEKLVMADALTPEKFKTDDVIIKEGEDGEKFYLVETGEVHYLYDK